MFVDIRAEKQGFVVDIEPMRHREKTLDAAQRWAIELLQNELLRLLKETLNGDYDDRDDG